MTVFGGASMYLELNNIAVISDAVNENIVAALFVMLKNIHTLVIGIVLVTIFFVTLPDSGSLVIDSINTGRKLDAPVET